MLTPRLDIPPVSGREVLDLADRLGVSFAVAQVLARRGLGDAHEARAWMACADEHPPSAFTGLNDALALILGHAAAGSRITVHGDYDVDGVTSTAILVRALRAIGADVDWHLPSRAEDGYGLSVATVERLAERGTRLLLTTDCGITAVDEVALARSLGLDVVVTDHHSPRADGTLPDAPIVHPALCGYPCVDLCAGGVAHKVATALLAAGAHDPASALSDLDLVALATIADCVPLRGENRRLVRTGLAALARTEKVGLRALMRIAQVDPSRVDAGAVGFRLGPRLNAAGRLHRADVALELLLTEDEDRAREIAEELDRANAERRFVETRILHEAEAQVAEQGERPAYVLAADGWHPGVIGIVASRIAERHHRPVVLVALGDGEEGTGSGRSIPGFDLLAGLDAAARHLVRHGGHRAAAGCTVRREAIDAFRAAFTAHAQDRLGPEDLMPIERVDAVVGGDELGQALAEELAGLAPFGIGNPSVSLLVPAARLVDPRPMGDGKHLRFTVEAGGVRAQAVAFGTTSLPDGAAEGRLHATFALELNEFRGAVEPRLVLRRTLPGDSDAPVLVGEPDPGTDGWLDAVLSAAAVRARVSVEAEAAVLVGAGVGGGGALGDVWDVVAEPQPRTVRDRRGGGIAGTIAALVHTGETVLVVCADAVARRRAFTGRLGGFAVCSYDALERTSSLADGYVHLVAVDPPLHREQEALLHAGASSVAGPMAHLAWGGPELRFAQDVLHRDLALRPGLVAGYRALRDGGGLAGALGGRPAHAAGLLLAVLMELELVELGAHGAVDVPATARTDLERSATFRWAARRHEEGQAWLSSVPVTAHAA